MSSSFVNRRREEIVRLLEKNTSMNVSDLTKRFGVSSLTIRRDLDHLVEEGIIERSYGMATLAAPHSLDTDYEREHVKKAIAARAAQLVEGGEMIYINTGTTALGILEYVTAEGVTVITNNGRALSSTQPPSSTIILTGGEIRVPKWSMTGDFALANIAQVHADKCFMSCSGLSAERGLTTNIAQEMRINMLMLDNSRVHIALADSSKIGADASFSYGEMARIDILVTDSFATDDQIDALMAAGVKKIIRVSV